MADNEFDDIDFTPPSDWELDEVTLPEITGPAEGYPTPTPEELMAQGAIEREIPMDFAEAEDQPEEMVVSNIYELIPIAIAQRRHLQIIYTGLKSGLTKTYVVEPYEIGGHHSYVGGYLWAFDIEADTIKSFLLSNLSDIQLLDTTFIPRY